MSSLHRAEPAVAAQEANAAFRPTLGEFKPSRQGRSKMMPCVHQRKILERDWSKLEGLSHYPTLQQLAKRAELLRGCWAALPQ